ncbi:hypothetical protein OIE13_34710 [Streptosporangium sp. NBC_01810]|uniref:hypothetical protein n=1 Tax=Streptosporangium sp. NBC_01810 TaxID=2975951 RepID=UPI002DDBD637|nr:hypothetical protein [Streptosporangium sp. NBC_01810]WSA25994.1 hypothetical protein OIE13_34710 [Streptosporangium sp. NBC_01810]
MTSVFGRVGFGNGLAVTSSFLAGSVAVIGGVLGAVLGAVLGTVLALGLGLGLGGGDSSEEGASVCGIGGVFRAVMGARAAAVVERSAGVVRPASPEEFTTRATAAEAASAVVTAAAPLSVRLS